MSHCRFILLIVMSVVVFVGCGDDTPTEPTQFPEQMIDFSGYRWKVKSGDLVGPGPNYFSDSESNVWIDAEGLHLKLTDQDGKWYCAEVVADQSFGYGEYTFQLGSRVDSLDFRTVFAGFIYESDSREVVIEFSEVLAQPDNGQYVVQPYYHPGNIMLFTIPAMEFSTHRFVWRSGFIEFTSWEGLGGDPTPDNTLQSWRYTGSDIPPPGGERMRFNLWLFQGKPPESSQGDEVIVKSFSYHP